MNADHLYIAFFGFFLTACLTDDKQDINYNAWCVDAINGRYLAYGYEPKKPSICVSHRIDEKAFYELMLHSNHLFSGRVVSVRLIDNLYEVQTELIDSKNGGGVSYIYEIEKDRHEVLTVRKLYFD